MWRDIHGETDLANLVGGTSVGARHGAAVSMRFTASQAVFATAATRIARRIHPERIRKILANRTGRRGLRASPPAASLAVLSLSSRPCGGMARRHGTSLAFGWRMAANNLQHPRSMNVPLSSPASSVASGGAGIAKEVKPAVLSAKRVRRRRSSRRVGESSHSHRHPSLGDKLCAWAAVAFAAAIIMAFFVMLLSH